MADSNSHSSSNSPSGKNVFEAAVLLQINGKKQRHGMSDDIDVNTNVKAPNLFERAKEEIEAIVKSILPKKRYKTLKKYKELE